MLACGTTETITKTIEVPGETIIVEKEVVKTVEIPGETITVTKEVVKEVAVPGETIVVEKEVEVVKEVEVFFEKLVEKVLIATPGPADTDFYMTTLDPNNKRGGTLITANNGPPSHWDFYAAGSITWHGVMSSMYDNLLRLDSRSADMTIVPEIGTTWELNPDMTEWTFKIRDGVRFHDGSDLTPLDVKATIDRMAFPPEGVAANSKGLWQSTSLREITATDDSVTFHLDEPRSTQHMMAVFSESQGKISSKANLDEFGGNMKKVDLSKVSGSGPFKFVEQNADHFVVEANMDYWNPNAPYLDGVETIWIPVFSPQLTAALQTKMIDFGGITAPADSASLLSTPGLNHATQIAPFYWHLLFNTQNEGFSDPRVRQAVALILDQEAMLEAISPVFGNKFGGGWHPEGLGMETYSPSSLAQQKYFRSPTDEDIAEAQQLLADAGYPNGEGFPVVDLPGRNNALNTIINELTQAFLLQHLGLESELRLTDVGSWRQMKANGEFDIALNNLVYSVPVPEYYIRNIVGNCDGVPCNGNLGKNNDPVLDELLLKIKDEQDPSKKYDISVEISDQLEKEMPFVPLMEAGTFKHWWVPEMKGFVPHGSQFATFWGFGHKWDHVWLDR